MDIRLASSGNTLAAAYTAPPFTLLRRVHYEYRMFISLAIATAVTTVALWSAPAATATPGLAPAFMTAALVLLLASVLRMWAGSQLTSDRVMSFTVQPDRLITSGPYQVVRNPIYLADIIAMVGVAVGLGAYTRSVIALVLPILFTVHYLLLIRYEEYFLQQKHGGSFAEFAARVPRLFPTWKSGMRCFDAASGVFINRDGARNNALYTLFVVGFIVASVTHEFWHAIVIGAPALFDWAYIHTRKGIRPEIRDVPIETREAEARERVATSKVFDSVLYSSCWEDPAMDRAAFASSPLPVPGSTIFTITSGGCNALAFLLDDPARVIALDLNAHQNHLLELKMAAFRRLTYDDMLDFFGVALSATRVDRRAIYREKLRWDLSTDAVAYWDAHEDAVHEGILHAGRFERYMRLLRTSLRLLIGRRTIQRMFSSDSRAASERAAEFDTRWLTLRWKFFRTVFLSRWLMSRLFDPAFFAQLDDAGSGRFSFGKHFEGRLRFGFTGDDGSRPNLDSNSLAAPRENPFLTYILFGAYTADALPDYLRREHFATIRSRLDRISLVSEPCDSYLERVPAGSITHFNFTNIFEWMPVEDFTRLLQLTIRAGVDGSVVTYRNLLVPRSRPASLAESLLPDARLSRSLALMDRSFIYRAYNVERIVKS